VELSRLARHRLAAVAAVVPELLVTLTLVEMVVMVVLDQ
jgi:hypothetical protein